MAIVKNHVFSPPQAPANHIKQKALSALAPGTIFYVEKTNDKSGIWYLETKNISFCVPLSIIALLDVDPI